MNVSHYFALYDKEKRYSTTTTNIIVNKISCMWVTSLTRWWSLCLSKDICVLFVSFIKLVYISVVFTNIRAVLDVS